MNAAETPKEREEGFNSNTDCDHDSELSCMGDTDEDIDTTETEEEWIEYLKRSTRLAEEKMRTASIPCWIMTHEKMKWRVGNEEHDSARDMVKKSSKMESRSQQWLQGKQSCGKTKKEMGRRHQSIPQA